MDNFDLRKYLAEQKNIQELEKGSKEFDIAKTLKLMYDIGTEHIKSPQAALVFVDAYRAINQKLQDIEDERRVDVAEPPSWAPRAIAE